MKKKKFSLIALSLGVLLAFPVIGCGGEEATPSQGEEAPPSQQECASNADCADPALPICDNGTCVAAPASNCPEGKFEINGACYAEGDECDPEDETLWGGICTGNKAVYCEDVGSDASGNRIYAFGVWDCGATGDGVFCGTIPTGASSKFAVDPGPEYISECVLPCDAAGELIFMCNPNNEDYEFDLLSVFYCIELADGSFGAAYDGEESCPAGCDATLNECIVPSCTTSTDCPSALPICDEGVCVANCPEGEFEIKGACYAEGDECDPDVHGDICSGDKSVYCNPTNKKIAVLNCATYITGMTCGMITSQFSMCVMPGCDTGGEKFDMCDATPGHEGRLMTYSCRELENGDFGGTIHDYKMCANDGCDAAQNTCNCTKGTDCYPDAPVCDEGVCVANCPDGEYEIGRVCYAEGDECDPDVVNDICSGDKAVYCNPINKKIAVLNCATYITGMTCGMITSQLSVCVMPGCDTGGEKFDMCDATPGNEGRLMTYSCRELENGDFGGTLHDYKMCANGCDATLNACIAPSCTSNADCTDPALPICDNGACVANCPDGKYEINGACYASGDECDSDDETLSYGICGMRKAVYCESQVIQVDNCRGACGVDSTAGGMRCLF